MEEGGRKGCRWCQCRGGEPHAAPHFGIQAVGPRAAVVGNLRRWTSSEGFPVSRVQSQLNVRDRELTPLI